MHVLKIALLQIAPCGSLEGNLEKGYKPAKRQRSWERTSPCFPKCGAMVIGSTTAR